MVVVVKPQREIRCISELRDAFDNRRLCGKVYEASLFFLYKAYFPSPCCPSPAFNFTLSSSSLSYVWQFLGSTGWTPCVQPPYTFLLSGQRGDYNGLHASSYIFHQPSPSLKSTYDPSVMLQKQGERKIIRASAVDANEGSYALLTKSSYITVVMTLFHFGDYCS